MATGSRSSVLRRGVGRTGKPKGRRSGQWLWPLIAPVGLGITVACGESWADPQVVSPSGLPVQVRPTYREPGLPAFSFPQGGATLQSGVGSGTTGTQGTSGTQGSSGTGASAATLADYQQYVGSYYGANEQCVSLTRDFDSSLPPSSQWQQGELVEGATDIAPGTPIATFNFNGAYGPPDSPGGESGVSIPAFILGRTRAAFRFSISGRGPAARQSTPFRGVHGVGTRPRPAVNIVQSSERSRDAESSVSSHLDDVVRSRIGRRQRSD
jgi:hypothetical protein